MLSGLLWRTAHRYAQAKQLVLSEHPNLAPEEFEKLVAEAVRRLADQEMRLQGDNNNAKSSGQPPNRLKNRSTQQRVPGD